ncbi:MAG: HNH endonuclease [Nitrososphaerota archaeon]|jgi:5-methylcytosine-specific restriction protein A|nr:HNH endonuclease [Nitrososphaerota archaeon]
MVKDLTHEQFVKILLDPEITRDINIEMFQSIYSFEGHKARASQIGRLLGYTGKSPHGPLNLEINRYTERIAKTYDIDYLIRKKRKYKFYDLFFEEWDEVSDFFWKLKPNLVSALEETKMTGDVEEPIEISEVAAKKLFEGAKRSIIVNAYERNSRARNQCIKYHGTKCVVCSFDFLKEYGSIGENYIQVHHLTPIHGIGKKYEIDPIKDLVPICPNCHVMIHRGKSMLPIEELRRHYMDAQTSK